MIINPVSYQRVAFYIEAVSTAAPLFQRWPGSQHHRRKHVSGLAAADPWIALSVMLPWSVAVIALGIPLLRGAVRYSRLYTGSSLELAGDVFAPV